jgi:hypothetical protein
MSDRLSDFSLGFLICASVAFVFYGFAVIITIGV